MELDPGLVCYRHCSKGVMVGTSLPPSCLHCHQPLDPSCPLMDTPYRLPYPFRRASQCPCSLVIRPARGDFLHEYKSGDALHIGVTDCEGRVHEFDRDGLRNDATNCFNACLVVDVLDQPHDPLWREYWSTALQHLSCQEDVWSEERYDEETFNCYSFVIEFLRLLNPPILNQFQLNKISFCAAFVVPKASSAAKYISLYRRLLEESVVALPIPLNKKENNMYKENNINDNDCINKTRNDTDGLADALSVMVVPGKTTKVRKKAPEPPISKAIESKNIFDEKKKCISPIDASNINGTKLQSVSDSSDSVVSSDSEMENKIGKIMSEIMKGYDFQYTNKYHAHYSDDIKEELRLHVPKKPHPLRASLSSSDESTTSQNTNSPTNRSQQASPQSKYRTSRSENFCPEYDWFGGNHNRRKQKHKSKSSVWVKDNKFNVTNISYGDWLTKDHSTDSDDSQVYPSRKHISVLTKMCNSYNKDVARWNANNRGVSKELLESTEDKNEAYSNKIKIKQIFCNAAVPSGIGNGLLVQSNTSEAPLTIFNKFNETQSSVYKNNSFEITADVINNNDNSEYIEGNNLILGKQEDRIMAVSNIDRCNENLNTGIVISLDNKQCESLATNSLISMNNQNNHIIVSNIGNNNVKIHTNGKITSENNYCLNFNADVVANKNCNNIETFTPNNSESWENFSTNIIIDGKDNFANIETGNFIEKNNNTLQHFNTNIVVDNDDICDNFDTETLTSDNEELSEMFNTNIDIENKNISEKLNQTTFVSMNNDLEGNLNTNIIIINKSIDFSTENTVTNSSDTDSGGNDSFCSSLQTTTTTSSASFNDFGGRFNVSSNACTTAASKQKIERRKRPLRRDITWRYGLERCPADYAGKLMGKIDLSKRHEWETKGRPSTLTMPGYIYDDGVLTETRC